MNNNVFNDKDFRKKLLANPKKAMSELNSEFMNDVEVVVKKNTATITYFVMPEDGLSMDNEFGSINAAGTTGSVSSVGSGATISTVTSTTSTLSTVGSAGTAGSAD